MRLLLFLTILLVSLRAIAAAPVQVTIAIQPLGEVTADRLTAVKRGLEDAFGFKVGVLAPRPLPKEAWYVPRARYRAEKLLTHLEHVTAGNYQILLGLTEKDISTTKGKHEDWGIFGMGELAGRVCVVSTFRLGARGAGEMQLCERLRKVAVHEAGHVMGLSHCPEKGCVMQDAESSIATVDAETGIFCAACKSGWDSWLKDNAR
jgi:archaemetzincin